MSGSSFHPGILHWFPKGPHVVQSTGAITGLCNTHTHTHTHKQFNSTAGQTAGMSIRIQPIGWVQNHWRSQKVFWIFKCFLANQTNPLLNYLHIGRTWINDQCVDCIMFGRWAHRIKLNIDFRLFHSTHFGVRVRPEMAYLWPCDRFRWWGPRPPEKATRVFGWTWPK